MSESEPARPSLWQSIKARLSGYEVLVPGGSTTVVDGDTVTYKGSFFLFTACCSSLLLLALVFVLLVFSGPTVSVSQGPYVRYHLDDHWHGWHSIEHMIVFGDSWSTTGFQVDGAKPSVDNPLGNPSYPGVTSTNVANWIDYLAYDYNQSLVLTANFAIGGATVIPANSADDSRSMQRQITQDFAKLHSKTPDGLLYDWKSNSSLFVIWIGINDVHEHFDSKASLDDVFIAYADLVDQLYKFGARNFFIVDVPPLEDCPLAAATNDLKSWQELVTEYNSNVDSLTWNFTQAYSDVTTFHFSSYDLLDDVTRNPCVLPESCGLTVTKGFCDQYAFLDKTGNYSDPACEAPVNQYLWINPLHITTVTHNVIAKAFSQALAV